MTLSATPGQTVGPFYGYALPYPGDRELVPTGHRDAIRLHGTVYDGAGNPVPDALLEIWQPDPAGRVVQEQGSLRRDGWTFTGFGRAACDDTGHYSFTTVVPGATEPGAAAFVAMTVFARGLLNRLFTRVYLPVDERAPGPGRVPADRPRGPATHPGRDARRARIQLRRQAAGRRRDRLPPVPGGVMADLLWPGDDRAGRLFAPATVLSALVRVEAAWLQALVAAGVVPATAREDLVGLVTTRDVDAVAQRSEASGNPVTPMLALLRERLEQRSPVAAQWVHRGLTSQDVLDTALMLCARDTAKRVLSDLDQQVTTLAALADRHRDDVMVGRTLTQDAVPITFGLKAAQWLQGVLDARDDLRRASQRLPAQFGGAAGTMAATAELVSLSGSALTAQSVVAEASRILGLQPAPPWHTSRAPLTRYADALVRATDAWGHIANDVLLLSRPELGELAEEVVEGRGGSSTMPQKANPVLSVLVRRAALVGPGLVAQLHLAAAGAVDERPDGSWHTEWSTLATLSRRTVTAGSQTTELLDGLHVDTGRMAAVVKQRSSVLLGEKRSIAGLFETGDRPDDFDPSHYLGATGSVIDQMLARARDDKETS